MSPAAGAPAGGAATTRAAKIWRRTIVGGTIAAVVGGMLSLSSFSFGTRLVHVVGLLIGIGAALEVGRMGFPWRGVDVRPLVVAVAAVHLVGWALWGASSEPGPIHLEGARLFWWGLAILPATALLFALLAALPAIGGERGRKYWRPAYVFVALWVAVPAGELFLVRLHLGVQGLVALVVLSKIGDIAGYYFGNLLGRTHPFPNISPGKTTAGCVASLIAGVLCALAFQAGGLMPPARFGWISAVLFGAVINLASQAGDLLESVVKRRAGVKDSGTLFGPSGGLLDLVDSLLLSIPAGLVAWPLLYHWTYDGVAGL